MKRLIAILSLTLLLSVLYAGCAPTPRTDSSSQPEPAVETADSQEITSESEEPVDVSTAYEEDSVGSERGLPDGWPDFIPLPPDSEVVDTETQMDTGNIRIGLETTASLQSTLDFFIDNLSRYDWIPRPEARTGDNISEYRLFYERDGDGLNVLGRSETGYTSIMMFYVPTTGE